jgi:spermine oxidase
MQNDDAETKRVKDAMIRRLLKQETLEHSSNTMTDITIADYGSYLKLTGPDFEFPGGFSTLIEFIASHLPQEIIKVNHGVEKISLDSNEGLKIKCFNGQIFYTEHIIVTCPLNYLKKNYSTLFQPGLVSKTKYDALSSMKMGIVNKIFLVYDNLDFFPKDFNSIHPLFFNDENYDEKSEWYLKLFTFDKFYDNVLLIWTTGDEAGYVESLSEHEIANVLTKYLKKFLKNDNIPLPRKMIK